jgi:ferredoxin
MVNRRTFLVNSSLSVIALSMPHSGCARKMQYSLQEPRKPKTAAVVWYSQTGNTERVGRKIADTLEAQGIRTVSAEYRHFNSVELSQVDLIIAGSPVYYYDVPGNFKQWLNKIPDITGKPVSCYVTFGGEGGNQYNTVRTLAGLFVEKGGVPVGLDTFGSMSTYAVTWSLGNRKRILKYSHLPDDTTFSQSEIFTHRCVDRAEKGEAVCIEKEFTFSEQVKGGLSIWASKLLTTNHSVNKDLCIRCMVCVDICPVGAIDPEMGRVDTSACVACLGCINNCPVDAVQMDYLGKKVYGLKTFKKMNGIKNDITIRAF